jgi:hypothetical protein
MNIELIPSIVTHLEHITVAHGNPSIMFDEVTRQTDGRY